METSYPIVVVDWEDASHEGGEVRAHEMRPLIRLRTVGFLVAEDDRSISVAMEMNERGDTFRDVSHIPKVNIVRTERVRTRNPRPPRKPRTVSSPVSVRGRGNPRPTPRAGPTGRAGPKGKSAGKD